MAPLRALRAPAPNRTLELPEDPGLERVLWRLSRGEPISDEQFDAIYPEWARALSRIHWTPIPVVRRALELLLEERPLGRVLDVGSGAGKFCLVGASISHARFVGIEQRPHLAALSQKLAARYGIPRVTFVEGDLAEADWSAFDAIYLYNPFQEHCTPYQRIDETIELSRAKFLDYVRRTRERLAATRPGARLVTYHGFGAVPPEGFRLRAREYRYRGPLECWIRV